MQREYEFSLPKGYVDGEGVVHKQGIMRLATAKDELTACSYHECRQNVDAIPVYVLSRVILRLGDIEQVTPEIVKELFTADFQFLQNMYESINGVDEPLIHVQCPHCGETFTDTLNFTLRA